MIGVVGYVGAIAGPVGAILLALNIALSPIGYVFFLVSSLSMTAFGVATKSNPVIIQNGLFCVINMIGLIRWLPLL